MAENRKAGDSMKRDLQADLEWINDPDVCISPKVREICNHAIRRAMEAEAENKRLREYAEKYRRMEEALRKIANPYDDLIGYIGSDAKYLIKIAKKALEGGKRDE